jgi:hypothetical protein
MTFAVLGAVVGFAALAPLHLGPFGGACGFLLGLYVALGARMAARDPDWSAPHAATVEYRVGALAIGGVLVALGLLIILAGAAVFASP